MEETPNGIEYQWYPSGQAGATFILMPGPEHTEDQINEAKRYLRAEHDVVRITVEKPQHLKQ